MTLTSDRISAALSIFGDLFLAGTITARRNSWQQPTLSALRCMALADLITSAATVMDVSAITNGTPCYLVAIAYWFGAWASWMWNAAYAYVVHLCLFDGKNATDQNATAGLAVVRLSTCRRWLLHVVCWGVPLGLVILVHVLPDASLGPGDEGSCTLHTTTFGTMLGFTSLLWVAMLYCALVFVSAHFMLRRSAETATKVWSLDSKAPRIERSLDHASLVAVRQRTKVWPRFLMYLLVFVLSQGPGVIWSLLGNPAWPDAVQISIGSISNLNGFLNAVVYGCTNVAVWRQWKSLAPCCCADDQDLEEALPSPSNDARAERFLDSNSADVSAGHPPYHSMSNDSSTWSAGDLVRLPVSVGNTS